MVSPAGASVTLRVSLQVPQSTLSTYEAEAKAKGATLETVLSSRLHSCVSHTSVKPLHLNDAERQHLEHILGKNLKSPSDLVEAVKKAVSVRVGNVDVHLQPTLLNRLRTRCFGKPFEDFLAERTIVGLEEYAGMR